MKSLILASFLVLSAEAGMETRCKADYMPAERIMSFTNLELDRPGETHFQEDCSEIFINMLRRDLLPVVDGERVRAHLLYELPEDDLFPMIKKFLAAGDGGKLKIEIRFSLPSELMSDDPMTTMTLDIMDRPTE